MVVTNSLSQGRARSASLEWLMESGGVITNAISTQDWSGEAAVDVSIVNWIKEPASAGKLDFVLDGVEIGESISASLTPASLAVESAGSLLANGDHAFYGCILGGGGFILEEDEAQELRSKGPQWESVIRPLLTGDDLTQRPDLEPSRWVIDFAFMDLEEAMQFPEALEIVRAKVKPQRDQVRRTSYRKNWWRFSEPIRGMRTALQGLKRYIACPSVAEVGGAFCWVDSGAIATSQATVFAFDDDYSMGILCSRIHIAWAAAQSSTLENRRRYTPSTAFETFPWPNATDQHHDSIAAYAAAFVDLRAAICSKREVGLNRLYQDLDEGAHADLAAAWRDLDRAVASAYGWPTSAADDAAESNRRLLERNEAILDGREPYAPFEVGSYIDH
jgi:restriction-modification enzyme MmeI-like protein